MLGPVSEEDTTNSLICLCKGLTLWLSSCRGRAGSHIGSDEEVRQYTEDTHKYRNKGGG